MPAGRKSKYSPERAEKILTGTKQGMTLRAAASLGGIDEDTLLRWREKYADFAEQLKLAEAEAEARYTQVLAKAAFGHEVTRTRITRSPVHDENGQPTGVFEETTVTEVYREYDWRAAETWLRRRNRRVWGDNVSIGLDDEITNLIAELATLRTSSE